LKDTVNLTDIIMSEVWYILMTVCAVAKYMLFYSAILYTVAHKDHIYWIANKINSDA